MRQLKSIAFTGMLALLMSGCASGDEEVVVSPTSPAPAVSPSPAATTPPQAQPFAAQKPPVVAQKPARVAAPALIQPTNADARTQQVSQGRQDPFALLPLPLVPVPPPPGSQPPAPQPVPQVRSVPNTTRTAAGPAGTGGAGATGGRRPTTTAARPNTTGGRPTTTAARPNTTGGRAGTAAPGQAGQPNIRPGTLVQPTVPSIAALPQLPQPTLAQSVEVSGVIQVGDEARAIVKAPNEATSRYVTVGQRLSNGQILVKRIEMNTGSEPVVVLEQYGIEVGKRVGDKPAQPAGGNPTA